MALEKKMIEPFSEKGKGLGEISYGLSSYGYDMRLSDEFKVFKGTGIPAVDPKSLPASAFEDLKSEICVISAGSFVLGRSVEYFRIPRNVLVICFGKSTYARCGIVVNVTPFEPEWEGYATIAISNTSSVPAKIYANEGIAQLIFLEAVDLCEISYADKKGRYQAQKRITLPKSG
jgi:dCTP deaminase